MLKLLFLYVTGLGLAWIGLCSLMFALSHWSFQGAMMPLLAGLLIMLIAGRFLLALVRIYLPPKNRRSRGIINYPE